MKIICDFEDNWGNQPDLLIYLGKKGSYHQFEEIGDIREVRREIVDAYLSRIEETTQPVHRTDTERLDWLIENHAHVENILYLPDARQYWVYLYLRDEAQYRRYSSSREAIDAAMDEETK